ncbi:hypothetical protein FQA39_LY02295 [Lamprigera yunnana]|nr:hypothetical protein FQA39_LY02295 [Lamprigera yunnana]
MFIDIILILNYINFVISEEIVFENNSDLNLFSDEKDIESEVFIIAPQAKRKINCSINEMYMGENKFNDYHHLPKETCVCANVAMVINPYKDLVPRKIFNSAYIQCAICLSMASQLQEWLAEFNIGLNNPKQEIEKIECAVNSFCKEGFSSLHLRNSFKHFKDIDKLLKYIYNEVEGNWSLLYVSRTFK